jgi:hypothetical protein
MSGFVVLTDDGETERFHHGNRRIDEFGQFENPPGQ